MRCGDFGLFPANIEHEAVYSADSGYLTIAIPKSELDLIGERFGEAPNRSFWSTAAMYRAPADATDALRRKCQLAGDAMTAFPRMFAVQAARTAMVEDLIDHFMETFEAAGAVSERRPSASRAPHTLVRQAEDYLRDQMDRPLQIRHLCAQLGVSERTLRRAFIDVVGIPPSVFLRRLRLSRVRQQLIQADRSRHTVGEIAMHNGFWELGRFASEYRSLFGEYPSETLAAR